jgi:hypothetical protein
VGEFVYIRHEGDGSEELFHERDDPRELINRAQIDDQQPVLQWFRDRLNRLIARPAEVAR